MIFAALLVWAGSASAQGPKIGVKGGINIASYTPTPVYLDDTYIAPVSSSGTGYQLGVTLRLTIPGFIFIQPDLLYVSRDYDYDITAAADTHRETIKTKRLEVPLMLGFNISSMRFFAGPVFRLSSSESNSVKDSPFSVEYNDSDVAFQAGIGLDIRKFFLEARYTTYFNPTEHTYNYGASNAAVKVKSDEQWLFNAGFFF